MQYDALNRLTNLVDAVGTNVNTYDAASQLLSEDGPWASRNVQCRSAFIQFLKF